MVLRLGQLESRLAPNRLDQHLALDEERPRQTQPGVDLVESRKVSFKQALNDIIRRGAGQGRPVLFRTETASMGPSTVDLDRALALAGAGEDEGLLRRICMGSRSRRQCTCSWQSTRMPRPTNAPGDGWTRLSRGLTLWRSPGQPCWLSSGCRPGPGRTCHRAPVRNRLVRRPTSDGSAGCAGANVRPDRHYRQNRATTPVRAAKVARQVRRRGCG